MELELVKCRYCGGDTLAGSVYCCRCGERLARKRKEKSEERTARRWAKPRIRKDGVAVGRIMIDGERVTVEGRDEADYYAKADAIAAGIIEARQRGPRVTLGEAIDRYIEEREKVLSPATIRGYQEIRTQRFGDAMGQDLREIQWQAMVNEEAGRVSPKTLRNAWGLVRSAAAAQGVEPPAVRLPQKIRQERPWLDYEQIGLFLGEIRDKPGELAALLALHSLRRAELLALRREDVDLQREEIRVDAVLVHGPGGMVTKPGAKTEAGRRVVPIMIGRLADLIEAAGDGPLVAGDPHTARRQINAACVRAGLPLVGVHGLRHSFASLAYHLGWSEAATMQVGGWTDPSVVHGIYTHLAQGDKLQDVERMREYYQKITKDDEKSQAGRGV